MRLIQSMSVAATVAAASGASALASITVTQGVSAPQYTGTTLNFDEPGTPTGVVPATTWQASHGVTIQAGDSVPVVGDFAPGAGWPLGTANSYFGNFGVFMTFEQDLTEISFQAWDPSGPPSPFGGGLVVFVFNDGVEVAAAPFTPAWGGVGNSWYNITTADGMVFDDVRVLGFGFGPTTYVDNLSWNAVPTPGALAILGVAGGAFLRRRRG